MDEKEKFEILRDALRDIVMGTEIMLQIPQEGAFKAYILEVRRVAEAALKAVRS